MYNFHEEEYSECIEEVKELIEDHYKEIALYQDKIELSPDYALYESTDALRIYTVRKERTLVGYFFVFIAKHPHYKEHLFANNDIIYIAKEHRNAHAGKGLILFAEERLKSEGVSVLNINMKTHQPFDNLMLSLGFDCVERVYGKYIGK